MEQIYFGQRIAALRKSRKMTQEALAQQLGIKNLVLYHTEDKTIATRKQEYTAECQQYFKGSVYVPEDLDIIALK